MRYLMIVVGCMFMFGCASVTKTYDREGKEAYSLNCSGTARNWNMCLEKAGELCGSRGYDIVSYAGEAFPASTVVGGSSVVAGRGYATGQSSFYGESYTSVKRTMTIRCK